MTMEKNSFTHDRTDKPDVQHHEYLHDHDILAGEKDVSREEAVQFANMSDDELEVQKKLVRKIDWLIMPLVILVYLMNYIDR